MSTIQQMFKLEDKDAKRLGYIVSDPYQPEKKTDKKLKSLGLVENFPGKTFSGLVPTTKLEKLLEQGISVYEKENT